MKTEPPQDTGYAPTRWAFDGEVTRVFDDMLARSIPQYDVMRDAVFTLGCRHVRPRTTVLDLGCSRGEALAPFIEKFGASNRFVGLEISPPMLAAARERFAGYINCGVVDVREWDLREGLPSEGCSLILAILTIQFVPINYRQQILSKCRELLAGGGALIVVEKVLGDDDVIDAELVERYHAMKVANGYAPDDVRRKAMALEGTLVPVTAAWNVDGLRRAGFRHVDCFWRWMNFAGFLAVA